MLAKITSKNQLTLPKSVTQAVGATEYFDVEARAGQIILTPVRIQRGDAVRAKLAELDLNSRRHRRCRGMVQSAAAAAPAVAEPEAPYGAAATRC
jgi:antitoxin component of MazEF toxin-antitoxin module